MPSPPYLPDGFAVSPFGSAPSEAQWPEVDRSLFEERRSPVPAFPIELVPRAWRDWVSDTARATGAPADYVMQSLLAAVASLCGAGVAVRVTESWSEPLVLWQLVVGSASSGKSPALAPVRRMLGALEGASSFVVGEASLPAAAKVLSAHPRGALLWREASPAWLGKCGDRATWLEAWAAGGVTIDGKPLASFPVSLFGTIQPDGVGETLKEIDGLAERLLFAWPGRAAFHPLAERRKADDEAAQRRLRRIARWARTPDNPLQLVMDARATKAFDAFLASLQDELARTEGLELAWLGKGSGTVARLAGMLELLAWSGLDSAGPPDQLGDSQIEAAIRLWREYFRPHARAVLERVEPSSFDRRARRVARWLREHGQPEVTREEVRCQALARSVDADGADQVLYRLTHLGVVRKAPVAQSSRGRPAERWQVNPALGEAAV